MEFGKQEGSLQRQGSTAGIDPARPSAMRRFGPPQEDTRCHRKEAGRPPGGAIQDSSDIMSTLDLFLGAGSGT